MENNSIIVEYRKRIQNFFQNNEKSTEFKVECELKDRIKFIYRVIFPNYNVIRFYGRFVLAKLAYSIDYSLLKVFIYRMLGMKIGKGVFISPQVTIDVHFPKLITIDDYAIIGYAAFIFTHDFFNNKYRIGKVTIGEGAVIGAFTKIGCGVEIGKMANIPANSMVLKDVPDFKHNDIVK